MRTSVEPSRPQANSTASRARFGVVSLLFVNVVINYMDRANLSVAAPALARDLQLAPAELGYRSQIAELPPCPVSGPRFPEPDPYSPLAAAPAAVK
jgi:hypothetical protein